MPKIDRSCTDLQRIPGVIIDVSGGEQIQFYQVVTAAGVIKTKFRTGDLTVYNGSVSPITDKYLSIREASHQINSSNKFTVNRCKCKGKCNNGQCSCIRSSISCTNHCHPSRSCENKENKEPTTDSQTKPSNFSKIDINILQSGWLTDKHMFAANQVMKRDYPTADGLQDTLLQQKCSWDVPNGEFVQILHVKGNHWISFSNINTEIDLQSSTMLVNVYDSSYTEMDQDTKLLIGNYTNANKAKINIMNVQQQQNGSDCGVFAIAFAESLLSGRNPTQLNFIDPRNHLLPIFLIIRFQISLQNQQEGHHKSWIRQLITSCCKLRRIRNMMLTFLVSFNKLNMG